MPNVSRKRLLQSIRKEKNTVAGIGCGRACTEKRDGASGASAKSWSGPTPPCETGYGACRRAVSAAGTTRNGADENVRYPRRYSGQSGAG